MAYLERSRLQPCPKITKLYGIAVGVIGFSFAFAPALVDAAPMEAAITGGNVSIHRSGVSTDIIQTTDKAIIDWQSFDATAGERVTFNQPSAQSVTLNRIHDSKPTNFDGSLNANGQVWLTNPHGMLFGNNARVDVGGLLATSSDIANADFMAGKNALTKPGDAEAQIINRGRITTSNGGSVALLAPHVANEGRIEAKLGKVQLAGGDIAVVDLYGDGLINLEITHATPTVDNSGIIIAEEGSVTLHAKQGLATDSGTIDVSGNKGGRIDVLGDHVGLLAHSTLNASGDTGGGIVRIGGGYQGKAREVPNATQTYFDKEATITASATQSGDAGRVIVWSNDKTGFYGSIEATSNNGTGGFVETSGHQLDALGTVTTRSLTGKTGTWLLDPNDITISTAADTGTMTWTGTQFQDAVAAASNLNTTTLQNRLATNNVIVTTAPGAGGTGNLTVNDGFTWSSGNSLTLFASNNLTINNAPITYSGAANNTLTLQANNTILFNNGNADILANGTGKLDVTLNSNRDGDAAGGAISLGLGSSIISNNGNISLVGGTTASGYAMGTAANPRGIYSLATLNAGAGNILMKGIGYAGVSATQLFGVWIDGDPASLVQADGNITINGTGGVNAAADLGWGVFLGQYAGAPTAKAAISSGAGIISLTGLGQSTTINSGGIVVNYSDVLATGAAGITFNGTGSAVGTATAYGQYLTRNSTISSVNGNITLNGSAGGDGSGGGNQGIVLLNSLIQSTGTGSSAGTITMRGAGGPGTSNNFGIQVTGVGAKITSVAGNIDIAGSGAGTTTSNIGVYVNAGGIIESTGTTSTAATVTIHGTGGNGTGTNHGVRLTGNGSKITSSVGNISVTGKGGIGTGTNNYGVQLDSLGLIESTGILPSAATITINGTGDGNGAGSNSNFGVRMNVNASIASKAGDISIIGTGGNRPNGLGAAFDTSTIIADGSAKITVQGAGGGGAVDIYRGLANSWGGVTASGAIALIGDTVTYSALSTTQTTGDVIVRPRSSGTLVGVGSPAVGLNITDAMLGGITYGGTLWLGDTTNTGTMTINTARVFNRPVVFATRTGSDILLNGVLSSTFTGNALTLASGANFQNTAGASALSAPAGNWRVYSTRPELNTKNGLSATELFGISYPTAVGGNNFFLYSYTAPSTGTGWVGGGSVTTDPLPPVDPVILPTTPVTTVPTTPVAVIPTTPDPVFVPVTVDIPPLIFHPVAIYSEQSLTAASHDNLSYTTQNQSGPSRARSNELHVEVEKTQGKGSGLLSILCDDSSEQQARCDLKW